MTDIFERLLHPTDRGEGADAVAAGLARFLHRAGRLKTTPRTGWLDRGVPPAETESVADHSFRVALLAWLAARLAGAEGATLDADRVLALALIHDLAEALTGDLTPYDPAAIPTTDDLARRTFLDRHHVRAADRASAKRTAEATAMADLLSDLPPSLAAALDRLWTELQRGESAESRFVKQADKLEAYLQSREYLAADPTRPMASFAAEVAALIDDPILAALRDAIRILSPIPYPSGGPNVSSTTSPTTTDPDER